MFNNFSKSHDAIFQKGHKDKWMSTDFYGAKSVVLVLVQIATILSGLTYSSGALFLRFVGINIGSGYSFYAAQRAYGRAIQAVYDKHMASIRGNLPSDELCCMADTRYDTPGKLYLLFVLFKLPCKLMIKIHLSYLHNIFHQKRITVTV